MRRNLLLILFAAAAVASAAPKVEISAVNPTLQFGENCSIQFNEIGITLAFTDLPRFNEIDINSRWMILLVFQNGQTLSSRSAQVTAVRSVQFNGKDQYLMTGQVLLMLAENVTSLPLRIFVSLDLLGGAVKDWQPGASVKKFVSSCSAPPAPGTVTTPSTPPSAHVALLRLFAAWFLQAESPARSFVITSTYNPRILLSPEPFTDNRIWITHETPFKSFASGTRHYWLNQVDIDLTDLASLSIKNEFGSLPPAFNIIDFRFTTGLTLKWKWRSE